MKVNCKLDSNIPGAGFVLKRGYHVGELDDRGVIWLSIATAAGRAPGAPATRRIGFHAARFTYMEETASAPDAAVIDSREAVKAAIRHADAMRAGRKGKPAVPAVKAS